MFMKDDRSFRDTKKVSYHLATAVYRSKIIASKPNKAEKHAEINLLSCHQMKTYRSKKIDIFVTRFSTNGHKMSRPCLTCSSFIKKFFPLASVYYTNERGEWIRDEFLDSKHLCLSDKKKIK